jgi:hypothetical protein
MKEIANKKFNDFAYNTIVGSSMWAYITHYLFIVLSANYIVRTFNFSYYFALFTNVLFTEICIFITFIYIRRPLHSLL